MSSRDKHLPAAEEYQATGNRPSAAAAFFVGFTFQHLICLAIAIILAASGLVSLEDLSFAAFSLIYVYFLSKVAFPAHSSDPGHSPPPVFGEHNKILGVYVLVGAVIGLFIPIAYILQCVLKGDKDGIKAASPHLFMLVCQVVMEGVAFSGRFSLPIRVFVPVFYNSRRIMTILDWIRLEMGKMEDVHGGGGTWGRSRVPVGVGIGMANLGFWCFICLDSCYRFIFQGPSRCIIPRLITRFAVIRELNKRFNLFGFLLSLLIFHIPMAFKNY